MTETNKYIQRLVKVISQKEKLIDDLKKKEKEKEKSFQLLEHHDSSIVESQLRQELFCMGQEIKGLVKNMELMQLKIKQLTSGLKEETQANQQLSQKIAQYQQNSINFKKEIERLEHELQKKQNNQGKVQELKAKYQILKKQEENTKYQNFQLKQKINTIFTITNKNKESNPELLSNNFEQTLSKLSQIQQFLTNTFEHQQGNILNETIEGISIIMHSFQQKLDHVHCLTERNYLNNIQRDVTTHDLKQSTRSVPPFSENPMHQNHKPTIGQTIQS